MLFAVLNEKVRSYFAKKSILENTLKELTSCNRAYGHYTPFDAWSIDREKGMREINIGAGTLARPIENVVATLRRRGD